MTGLVAAADIAEDAVRTLADMEPLALEVSAAGHGLARGEQ